MLAELAAANAAFSVIKQFVSNGKELSGCAKHISDFVFSKEEIEKNLKKKKARGAGGADLDPFPAPFATIGAGANFLFGRLSAISVLILMIITF